MKVFISWSGDQSKEVGRALVEWLPRVLQAVKPWFSADDLRKGRPWAEDLSRELAEVKIGVFCLTPSNVAAPWIAFEAAACHSKAGGRVFTYLHGIRFTDVTGPLSIFNHTPADRDGTFDLVKNVNELLPAPLPPDVLKPTFDTWWPSLESRLKAIPALEKHAGPPPTRSDRDLIQETLEIVRALQQREPQPKPLPVSANQAVLRESAFFRQLRTFGLAPTWAMVATGRLEGLSFTDIGTLIGITSAAAATLWERGMKRLGVEDKEELLRLVEAGLKRSPASKSDDRDDEDECEDDESPQGDEA